MNILFGIFLVGQIILRVPKNLKIRKINSDILILILVFLILGAIAIFRAMIAGHLPLTFGVSAFVWQWLVFGLGIIIVSRANNLYEFQRLLNSVISGVFLYVLLNVILMLLDIRPNDYEPIYNYDLKGIILTQIGLDWLMLQPPLASAPKTISVVCLFLAICSAPYSIRIGRVQRSQEQNPLIAIFAISMVLYSDARMALVTFFIIYFLALSFSKATLRILMKITIVLSPLLPIIIVGLAGVLQEVSIIQMFSRNDWNNISTLSNRTYIWENFMTEAVNFNYSFLVGYGLHGQIESGISQQSAYIFDARIDDKHHSLHNTIFQMYIDRGLIGLAIFILLVYFLISRISKAGEIGYRTSLGVFAIFVLGQTESLFILSPVDSLTVFILLLAFSTSAFIDSKKTVLN